MVFIHTNKANFTWRIEEQMMICVTFLFHLSTHTRYFYSFDVLLKQQFILMNEYLYNMDHPII